METEWIHSETCAEIRELLELYPVDYLVGSVHHLYEIPIDFSEKIFKNVIEKAASTLSLEEQSSNERDVLALDIIFQDYFDAQYEMLVSVSFKFKFMSLILYIVETRSGGSF